MRHARLFSIRVVHAYYADGRCPALALAPRPSTAKLLAGRRLLARAMPDGLDLLAQVDEEGQPFISLEAGLSLSFDLRAVDPELHLFTELANFQALEQPLLRNQDGALELSEGSIPLARGALAVVEIGEIDGAWTDAPPTFTLTLTPREVRWVYYYVGSDTKISISDEDPERRDDPLEFDTEAATNEGDRIAEDLARRYPDHERLRLVSRQSLACCAAPRRHLALSSGKTVLTDELPNPALRNQSTILIDGQTQDSLYQVLSPSPTVTN